MLWSHETTVEPTGSCLIATLKLCEDVSCNSRVCGVPADEGRAHARAVRTPGGDRKGLAGLGTYTTLSISSPLNSLLSHAHSSLLRLLLTVPQVHRFLLGLI